MFPCERHERVEGNGGREQEIIESAGTLAQLHSEPDPCQGGNRQSTELCEAPGPEQIMKGSRSEMAAEKCGIVC